MILKTRTSLNRSIMKRPRIRSMAKRMRMTVRLAYTKMKGLMVTTNPDSSNNKPSIDP